MAPQVGQLLNNKYRLVRHIGDGGMGSVFEARHEGLGTAVALKFLHVEFTQREGLVQRFVQEARVAAQIQSPFVVRVTDVDQTGDGQVFIVLEYIEGRTLQGLYEDLARRGERLPYADALQFATQILDGVEAAHSVGVVHRDLKPDNVMISRDSKGAPLVKLLDFGIAKLKMLGGVGLTRPGVVMGTPEYMAPEQAVSADAVDVRADVFSLGVMLFEMFGGRRPVLGDDPQTIFVAYRTGEVARLADLVPSLPRELCTVVHKAIAPNPDDRFPTVAALGAAILPFAFAARPAGPTPARPGTIGVFTGTESLGTQGPARAAAAIPKTLPPEADPMGAQVGIAQAAFSGGPSGRHVGPHANTGTLVDPAPGRNYESTAQMGPAFAGVPAPPPATARDDYEMGYGGPGPHDRAVGYAGRSPARPRPRGQSSLVIVAVSAAVIGTTATIIGYLATQPKDDGPVKNLEIPPPAVTLAPVGTSQPPPEPTFATPAPLPQVPAPQPMPGPGPRRTPRPSPTAPAPRPSGSAAPAPPPSAAPPPGPQPFIIPSALPFPNPFDLP